MRNKTICIILGALTAESIYKKYKEHIKNIEYAKLRAFVEGYELRI